VSNDDIQWWAAPPQYQHLQFHVFIGEPNADRGVVLKDVVGPVGFIRYGAGHLVAVFATVVVLNPAEPKTIADLRASASNESMKDPVSMVVWGDVVDDGTPHLIDIALR
jgi:succinyl-CoA synthetase beta subunit